MSKVHAFTLQNDRGQSILASELGAWMVKSGRLEIFGPVVAYSWEVNEVRHERSNMPPTLSLHELPDTSGFIGFEKGWKPNNCLLLDCYGKERMRLTVPWQLTRPQNQESAKPPTTFVGVGVPCVNPASGKDGKYGVKAWVELAGMYYFELDYHIGQFLWGREIRD